MSRVTIGKIAVEYNNATFGERQRTKDIEIVPRKMVEDIINYCGEVCYTSEVKAYAKALLEKFEEGEDE